MVNFSVDGISTANVRQNGALQDAYPSQEGISAVKVTAFNNSAEFSQVGDVTFTTKNGTNQIHGSLFEYLQNQALDASPYGFSGKAPKKFNTFGGSSGWAGDFAASLRRPGQDVFLLPTMKGTGVRRRWRSSFWCRLQAERGGDLSGFGSDVVVPQSSIRSDGEGVAELLSTAERY